MNTPTVQAAEYQLQQAQEALDKARRDQGHLDSFTVRPTQYAVMARVPDFGQFVSYSTEGILAAVFDSEVEAMRYASTVAPPAGTCFVVDVVQHYA